MIIDQASSHLDHGLTEEHLEWLLERFGDRDAFFIECVEMPDHLEPLEDLLYGPAKGDAPIREDEVVYTQRADRPGKSRMIMRPARSSQTVVVIGGPKNGESCVLYTAYGSPVIAPREPFDPGIQDDPALMAESREFWAQHALATGEG